MDITEAHNHNTIGSMEITEAYIGYSLTIHLQEFIDLPFKKPKYSEVLQDQPRQYKLDLSNLLSMQ